MLKSKFYNQIYYPALDLMKNLCRVPLCADPTTNVLLHQFEGLLLHVNHFAERNNISNFRITEYVRDTANSIKHIRPDDKNTFLLSFCTIYEYKDGMFRFIRNSAYGKCENIELDLIKEICDLINNYISHLEMDFQFICPIESTFGFHDHAISYHTNGLTLETKSANIRFVSLQHGLYCPIDPHLVRYVVFGEEALGVDIEYLLAQHRAKTGQPEAH